MSREEFVVVVQLRRIFFHHLLRIVHCVLVVKRRLDLVCLLFWVFVDEEIFDLAGTRRCLVDGETCGKFSVCTYLDRIQHRHGEILAVVADDVVRWSFRPHIVNDHLA